MKRLALPLLLFLLVLFIGACAPAATPAPLKSGVAPAQPPYPAAQPTPAPAATGAAGARGLGGQDQSAVPGEAATERMIVYNVSLSLQVEDAEKALEKVRTILAQTQGGYVSAANLTRTSSDKMAGNVSVRIPAKDLDATLTQIKGLGTKVLSEKRDSSDVTDQYVDLDSRRRNLEATEQELIKLLDTVRERSNKAEDILAVYRELTNIRTQIEQIKGRQNLLSNTSALATVTINLVPVEQVRITEPDQWLPNQTAAQALRQLVRALQGLTDAGITFTLLVLPLLIIMALPFVILFLLVRWFVRRKRQPKAAATA